MGRGGDLQGGHVEEIWVPITLHLPIGFAKSWRPSAGCAPASFMCGPYAIILLAQLGNTVLVPVLPFLVREMGYSRSAYGALQSATWMSQTILSPLLGALSDRLGRRNVIFVSLLVSAAGCLLLGLSKSYTLMILARIITGAGFQIALFRAYFADTTSKEKRTGTFGLIGVTLNGALIVGPVLGGFVSQYGAQLVEGTLGLGGKRVCALVACTLFLLAALTCALWQPDEVSVEVQLARRASAAAYLDKEKGDKARNSDVRSPDDPIKGEGGRNDDGAAANGAPRRLRSGVKYVRVEVESSSSCLEKFGPCGRGLHKLFLLIAYLAQYNVFPLLTLNFFFRFAFAAYKSNFPYLCEEALNYGPKEVGFAVSAMGVGGMFVQGVLVRVVSKRLGEHKTLALSMASTSVGYAALALVSSSFSLAPCLSLIAIGYGLAVPCISTLFAEVPVEQGVMQGVAGSIDRFGQVFGPVVGGLLLDFTGLYALMVSTGGSLAAVSTLCLAFIIDLSWMGDLLCCRCSRLQGSDGGPAYAAVREGDEEEEGEKTALLGGPSRPKELVATDV